MKASNVWAVEIAREASLRRVRVALAVSTALFVLTAIPLILAWGLAGWSSWVLTIPVAVGFFMLWAQAWLDGVKRQTRWAAEIYTARRLDQLASYRNKPPLTHR